MKNKQVRKLTPLLLAMTVLTCTALCAGGCGSKEAENAEQTAESGDTAETAETETDSDGNADASEADAAEETDATEAAVESATEEATEIPSMYPYSLEDGKLIVESVFQSSEIINTDSDNAEESDGQNLASIHLTNNSGETLVDCELTVVMPDGQSIPFTVNYLPAGESVMAFATDDATIETLECQEITVENAEFTSEDLLAQGKVELKIAGTSIVVTNNSGADLTNVTVYYHNLLSDMLYGGKAMSGTIDSLAAGKSATVMAMDAIFGNLEVTAVMAE